MPEILTDAYLLFTFVFKHSLRGCFITIVNLWEVCLGALPHLQ